ncbi:uncharacterized protein BYT42DRAFT_550793 [Radiomyces spectabilis]|uniref:uncharacterized protein n=1 Tax=Radiomyces spectabilis TaxID=64574 RepID=UPI00221F068C|nr:uncharacterized protein BYT42DRAFT_550793 [Radiomyces spectabilis]KAI8393371.1 hypothetical protein BYT42DRAFT_550793 [Radiomyces spectabilis]
MTYLGSLADWYHERRWRKTHKNDIHTTSARDENYEEVMSRRSSAVSMGSTPGPGLAPRRHSSTQSKASRRPSSRGLRRSSTRVKLRRIPEGGRRVFVNLPLPKYEIDKHGRPKQTYVSNKIRTSKYTLLTFVPKNLFEQFRRAANIYFLFMAILQLLPYFGVKSPALTLLPICAVVAISAIKDGFEDWQRHKVDARFNGTPTHTLIGYDNPNYPAHDNQHTPWYTFQKHAPLPIGHDENQDPNLRGVFNQSLSMNVRVGDLILLRNGDSCPADAVLLSSSDETGLCFVETKDLDGETNLKPRHGVPAFTHIQSGQQCLDQCHFYVECGAPSPDLYSFEGTLVKLTQLAQDDNARFSEETKVPLTIDNMLLRGHVIRNTEWAIAAIIFTGTDTRIMLNSGETPSKRSQIEKEMNEEVLIAFLVLFILCLVCAIMAGVQKASDDRDAASQLYTRQSGSPAFVGFTNFWASLIIFQNIIPISLYVSIEFIKTLQAYFIWNDLDMWDEESEKRCIPKSWNLSDDLGQIEYIFSDKTGTLTRNIMEFRECSIGGQKYGDNGFAKETEGARGARLRKEQQQQQQGQQQQPFPNADAAELGTAKQKEISEKEDEQRQMLEHVQKRNAIFQEYEKTMRSIFTPQYASLDPERLSFADPRVFHDLQPDSKSENANASRQRQLVQEFFLLLSLCHTVIVEKLDAEGRPMMKDAPDDVNDEEVGEKVQPQVLENEESEPSKSMEDQNARNNTKKSSSTSSSLRQTISKPHQWFRSLFRRSPKQAPEPPLRRHSSRVETIASANRLKNLDNTVIQHLEYKAESPDEAALVGAAKDIGFAFVQRNRTKLTMNMLGQDYEFELLNVLEFNSTRKRMSVILRRPAPWNDIVLYCKGADNVVMERLAKQGQEDIIRNTQDHIDQFSNDGLRTLVIAWRTMDENEYQKWNEAMENANTAVEGRQEKMEVLQDRIERDLILLGATGIEDKLQEGVPQCIENLRIAGIKIWVLTGDKLETAINIGYASNLLDSEMKLWTVRGSDNADDVIQELEQVADGINKSDQDTSQEHALIIEGSALAHAFNSDENKAKLLEIGLLCKSVICCRVSPLQKALVVELVRRGQGAVTLAVGDGANDVSMIQAANVGVGIAGQEGVQASMASDYAIAQFRFLQKLLLVQGHWSYERVAEGILNFFFKNIFWVFPSLWYQIYSRFSGNIFYDYSFLQLYNIIFTLAPIIVLGCTDQDITAPYLMRYPTVYNIGIRRKLYTKYRFWLYFADAIWQSLVVFYAFYFLYESDPNSNGHPESMLQFSTSVAVTAIFLANAIPGFNTYYWTWIQFLAVGIEMVITFLWIVVYGAFSSNSLYGMAYMVFGQGTFWMTFLIAIVLAFLPRFIINFIHQWWYPNELHITRQLELDEKRKNRKRTWYNRWCC